MDQPDHDLLVRTDEQVKNLKAHFEHEIADTDRRLTNVEKDVLSLSMSRAKLAAISATISAATGLLIKLFWK